MFPVPLLLCYAGLVFCFHRSASIHLKEGKLPITNRNAQTSVELGSALCLLMMYMCMHTQTHVHLCCVYGGQFAKCSTAQAESGINLLAAGPLDLSSQQPPPVPFLLYKIASSASSPPRLPIWGHSFLKANNELCSSDEEKRRMWAEMSHRESRAAWQREI